MTTEQKEGTLVAELFAVSAAASFPRITKDEWDRRFGWAAGEDGDRGPLEASELAEVMRP